MTTQTPQAVMSSFRDAFWGPTGFEELRRLLKQGADFSKEVVSILQERSELEAVHAKSLAKLSQRLARAARDAIGTSATAWQEVATQLEREAQLHRGLSRGLSEGVCGPLRASCEAQAGRRKALEAAVERRARAVRDRRALQDRTKRHAYHCARINEQAQGRVLEPRSHRGMRLLTDRDLHKLESKRRKAENALTKAEGEYYGACMSAEQARQEWETLLFQTAGWLQALEQERLEALHAALSRYAQHLLHKAPQALQCAECVQAQTAHVDAKQDIEEAVRLRATAPNVPEQLLPDFYAEDLSSPMQPQRRKEALERLLQLLQKDLDTERRGKQGVESLAQAFRESPRFGDEEAQLRVQEKLQQLRQSLAFLEASRHKVQCCLAGLEGQPRPPHPLAPHLEQRRDRQGLAQTVLKIPPWLQRRSSSAEEWDRGAADGGAEVPVSLETEQEEEEQPYANVLPSQCRALYDYQATMDDELSLRSGDLVTVHSRAEDGWWHGEKDGHWGVFPASYVQELGPKPG
ncbi:nostrin isoform X1 [Dermacentor andersoni]|uniref:nostrin isoform X1 n=1 Tax=Dermacentor andersoni TaxID=34620 RepID=UPI002155A1A0|nr:nostrin-like isoform X1 [Dermacentor andersoni]